MAGLAHGAAHSPQWKTPNGMRIRCRGPHGRAVSGTGAPAQRAGSAHARSPADAGFTPDKKHVIQIAPEARRTLLEIDESTGTARPLFAPLKEDLAADPKSGRILVTVNETAADGSDYGTPS